MKKNVWTLESRNKAEFWEDRKRNRSLWYNTFLRGFRNLAKWKTSSSGKVPDNSTNQHQIKTSTDCELFRFYRREFLTHLKLEFAICVKIWFLGFSPNNCRNSSLGCLRKNSKHTFVTKEYFNSCLKTILKTRALRVDELVPGKN